MLERRSGSTEKKRHKVYLKGIKTLLEFFMNVFPRAFARMLEDSYFHCKRFAEAKTISSSSQSLSPLLDNTTELRFSARFSFTLRKENTFSLVTQLGSPLTCLLSLFVPPATGANGSNGFRVISKSSAVSLSRPASSSRWIRYLFTLLMKVSSTSPRSNLAIVLRDDSSRNQFGAQLQLTVGHLIVLNVSIRNRCCRQWVKSLQLAEAHANYTQKLLSFLSFSRALSVYFLILLISVECYLLFSWIFNFPHTNSSLKSITRN